MSASTILPSKVFQINFSTKNAAMVVAVALDVALFFFACSKANLFLQVVTAALFFILLYVNYLIEKKPDTHTPPPATDFQTKYEAEKVRANELKAKLDASSEDKSQELAAAIARANTLQEELDAAPIQADLDAALADVESLRSEHARATVFMPISPLRKDPPKANLGMMMMPDVEQIVTALRASGIYGSDPKTIQGHMLKALFETLDPKPTNAGDAPLGAESRQFAFEMQEWHARQTAREAALQKK